MVSGGGARVTVNNLTWRPFARVHPVLQDVSFVIEPGEHVLLVGASGSGKSSLLRAVAGVLHAADEGVQTGTIVVESAQDSAQGSAHGSAQGSGQPTAQTGLLLQDPANAGVAHLVGRDVAFGLENQGVPRGEIWNRVRDALNAVTFPFGAEHPVGQVSGGEGQRLALAGVLVMSPRLILLDEPTSMLDTVAADAVRHAVRDAAVASGATLIVVEHRFAPWLALMDRLLVLGSDGHLVASGPVDKVLTTHRDILLRDGVWIPGEAPPLPLTFASAIGAPATLSSVGDPLVRAEAVTAASRHSGIAPVFTDVTLEIRAGELTAIVGPSGAGKSTLAMLLAGLRAPTSGRVILVGTETDAQTGTQADTHRGARKSELISLRPRELARHIGWVPQQAETAVVGRSVVADALRTSRELGVDLTAATARVDALLAAVNLSALQASDPHQLSGGETRRLALVGAVAHGPSVLVLDEPTVGQDRHTWAAVTGLILAARSAGMAVVVTTHDDDLIALADHVVSLLHESVPLIPLQAAPRTATLASPLKAPLAVRAGPLSLMLASFVLFLGALSMRSLPAALVGIGAVLAFSPLVIGWRLGSPARLIPGLIATTSIGFSTWLLSDGHDPIVAAAAGLKIAYFVVPTVVLATMIDPSALGDHLAQRLRFPARPVLAAVAALQQFQSLTDQWMLLRGTRRVRGIGGGRSPLARGREFSALTFEFLVHTLRRAGAMSVAMESRGFSTARESGGKRTWTEGAPWTASDTMLVGIAVLAAIIPLAVTVTL
jgi:energy-coupling factor transporter ATP-binding protein EcfA2